MKARQSKHILVTGGAGYVGSHACKVLRHAGYIPVTIDDLSTGWAEAVKFGPFVQGNLTERDLLDQIFETYRPVAVMHFAGLSQVGEALHKPGLYWRNNVLGSLTLIEAAIDNECLNFVFSSTCATYGDQDGVIFHEDCPQLPSNAYGGSKLAVERMLLDFGVSHGLNTVIFRYFNVAGADPDGEVGEFHRPETHLLPLILDAIGRVGPALTIHGDDYDTPDGTCIRDFVHVVDLIDAHLAGLRWLEEGRGNRVFNLGTGRGFSVWEVIENAGFVTNRVVPCQIGKRRPGDCAKLVSDCSRAHDELGWRPLRSTLKDMILDAWRWHQNGHYSK